MMLMKSFIRWRQHQKSKRRILNPRAKDTASINENASVENQTIASTATEPQTAETKLIYKQPKITPAEFLDDAKR